MSKKKSRSMTFGKRIKNKLGQLYKTRTSDFRRYHAGHRSSISVGGILEYPELEIPRPSFEPVLLSGPRDADTETETASQAIVKKAAATPLPSSPQRGSIEDPKPPVVSPRPRLDAVDWAKAYEDCVFRPRYSSDEEIAPDEIAPGSHSELELDAALQAEVDKVRDEALRAADECLKRSMEIERFPKRV